METTQGKNSNWKVIIPLSLFLFFDFFQLNIMSTLNPFILKKIAISTYEIGLISSLFFYVNLILLFPAGFLLDRFEVKWLMTFSILTTIVGILLFAIYPNTKTMIIWRVFSGFSGAFSYISCVKILATNFPRKFLGLLLGLTGIVIMLAGVTVQYPLLKILTIIGLSNTFLLNALFGLIVILMIVSLIKDNSPTKIVFPESSFKLFLDSTNWLIALYACLTNLPLFILGAVWGNLYLIHTHHFSLESSSLITSMIFVGNMLGAPTLGKLSDKIGNRKHLMIFSALLMLATTVSIMLTTIYSSALKFIVLFFLLGFSTGSQTLAYALVVDLNSRNKIARATSMLSFLSVGGGAIAQPLFGFVIQSTYNENYQNGMYIILFASLLALVLSITLMYRNNHNRLENLSVLSS